jgi:hypothetical protein
MDNSLDSICALLGHGSNNYIGFGHGQIKSAAELAAQRYGCEWAKKHPSNQEAIILRRRIRDTVMSHTPKNHSNRDVVWQRFRLYALDYSEKYPSRVFMPTT